MKNCVFYFVFIFSVNLSIAQVGIGTTTPDASSSLDISSSNSGLLIPRVSLTDVNDGTTPINNPATSLLVFNVNAGITGGNGVGYYYWSGTQWTNLSTPSSNDWSITGNAGTNPATNFIGTTDDNDLVFKRNNIISGRIKNTDISLGTNAKSDGQYGVAIGYNSQRNGFNTSFRGNTSVGAETLTVDGYGDYNTAIGYQSLFQCATNGNTAVGAFSLSNLVGDNSLSGWYNIGIGINSQVPNNYGNHQMSIANVIYGLDMQSSSTARIGIGTQSPTSKLNVNGQVTIDQKNFGGYGGLLIKGDQPGNNYPNITFSTLNDTGNDEIAAYIGGNINDNTTGSEAMDINFLTSTNGLAGLSEKMRIKDNGNVGIGETNPSEKLEIAGKIKITDGTEGVNKILTSDANGVGTWTASSATKFPVFGTFGTGATFYTTSAGQYTTASITLPPGKWAVSATLLILGDQVFGPPPFFILTPRLSTGQSLWMRTYFSDSPLLPTATTNYIPGSSSLISGNLTGPEYFGLVNGTVFIENNSGGNKPYYLWAGFENMGAVLPVNFQITGFGSGYGEDQIIAIPMN